MPIEAARLLTALSLDSQVALTLEQRRYIWDKLWREHLSASSEEMLNVEEQHVWHLSPALLTASEFQSEVWAALISLQPVRLDLENCSSLLDLTPLAALPKLQLLFLQNCRGVRDFAPLARL